MSVAQTLTAGILEKAATLRNDDSILVHIRGRDCVAIEARYHKRCYQRYTKCLSNKPRDSGPTLYDAAFEEFCTRIIDQRIIRNKEILLLNYLLKAFTSCVQEIEHIDVPYQAARLKTRIQMRYPQIIFHSSKTMNKGTLVYADTLNAGEVADDMMEIDTNTDDEDDDDNEFGTNDREINPTSSQLHSCSFREFFSVAMEIRKLLRESKGIDADWPPDSHDLTLQFATKSIPVKLYNFLAWAVGFSDEPTGDERVKINENERTRVVSIAQDLVYAESKGKKFTHKSLALGMTVRQITGSVRLLRILHGLGHTASVATVYKHDTALAIASSRGEDIIIPRNINPGLFATIVWDNNDFNEETASGKGTTHVANGIMLQNGTALLGDPITVSKSCRTLQAPETYITPYTSREKGTISLRDQSSDICILEESYQNEQQFARNADFVYVLSRKYASESGLSFPGWTGFNTQAHKEVPTVTNIGYLPVIDAPVTDVATVNALLEHSVSICQRLQLPEIVLVFDEALYAKAQMIRWKNEVFKSRLVIRLGDFHTIMSFCSAIAKLFKDAGLQVSFLSSNYVSVCLSIRLLVRCPPCIIIHQHKPNLIHLFIH